jgi:hypothetical protein
MFKIDIVHVLIYYTLAKKKTIYERMEYLYNGHRN